MRDLFKLFWWALFGLFRSRAALQAEVLVLRHQLNILRRQYPKHATLRSTDRLVFTGLYGLAPGVLDALKILKPGTVIRWHRAGFCAYWRWKSQPRGGRPTTSAEVRALVREMSIANPLWGARDPRRIAQAGHSPCGSGPKGASVTLTARPTKRSFRLVLESHDGRALVPIPERSTSP
jgi:hypothetical protein